MRTNTPYSLRSLLTVVLFVDAEQVTRASWQPFIQKMTTRVLGARAPAETNNYYFTQTVQELGLTRKSRGAYIWPAAARAKVLAWINANATHPQVLAVHQVARAWSTPEDWAALLQTAPAVAPAPQESPRLSGLGYRKDMQQVYLLLKAAQLAVWGTQKVNMEQLYVWHGHILRHVVLPYLHIPRHCKQVLVQNYLEAQHSRTARGVWFGFLYRLEGHTLQDGSYRIKSMAAQLIQMQVNRMPAVVQAMKAALAANLLHNAWPDALSSEDLSALQAFVAVVAPKTVAGDSVLGSVDATPVMAQDTPVAPETRVAGDVEGSATAAPASMPTTAMLAALRNEVAAVSDEDLLPLAALLGERLLAQTREYVLQRLPALFKDI